MRLSILSSVLILLSSTGCSTLVSVKPWEKGYLAKPEMLFETDILDSAFVEHTYSSKEASAGGASVGGGGCGCN